MVSCVYERPLCNRICSATSSSRNTHRHSIHRPLTISRHHLSKDALLPLTFSCHAQSNPALVTDWAQRMKIRTLREVQEAAQKKRMNIDPDSIKTGFTLLESIVPGFCPNLESMKATDWALLAMNAPAAAQKVIILKTHYPGLDLAPVFAARPQMLLQSDEELDAAAVQVKRLLADAKSIDSLLQAIPCLMDPKVCISVLVTVRKWYNLKRDPIEVLEADPDLLSRAQANDVPLEPVYEDEEGNLMAPLLNYKEKRADWQAYIDHTTFKQE